MTDEHVLIFISDTRMSLYNLKRTYANLKIRYRIIRLTSDNNDDYKYWRARHPDHTVTAGFRDTSRMRRNLEHDWWLFLPTVHCREFCSVDGRQP